jgi:hypothetical protein
MVKAETCAIQELFNCLSIIQLIILSEAKNLRSFLSGGAHGSNQRCFAEPVLSEAEGLNITRHGPELELQPARPPLQ